MFVVNYLRVGTAFQPLWRACHWHRHMNKKCCIVEWYKDDEESGDEVGSGWEESVGFEELSRGQCKGIRQGETALNRADRAGKRNQKSRCGCSAGIHNSPEGGQGCDPAEIYHLNSCLLRIYY